MRTCGQECTYVLLGGGLKDRTGVAMGYVPDSVKKALHMTVGAGDHVEAR